MKYISLVCCVIWVITLIRHVSGHSFGDFVVGSAFLISAFYFLERFTKKLMKEGNSN